MPIDMLRLLPAGAVAGWGSHPQESAALSRRTRDGHSTVIPLIDGTRTRGELALEIARRHDVCVTEASAQLDEMLTKCARAGHMAD